MISINSDIYEVQNKRLCVYFGGAVDNFRMICATQLKQDLRVWKRSAVDSWIVHGRERRVHGSRIIFDMANQNIW